MSLSVRQLGWFKNIWKNQTFRSALAGGGVALASDLAISGAGAATANHLSRRRDRKLQAQIDLLKRRTARTRGY